MNRLVSFVSDVFRALLQAFAIVVVVFLLVRAIPGDAVDFAAIQGDLNNAQQTELRGELGLDRSIATQFVDWVSHAATGDFGTSLRFGRPVAGMVWTALPATLGFAAMSFAIGMTLAFGLALLAAGTGRRIYANLIDGLNIWSIAMPTFCAGVIGIFIFAIWLRWTPVLGAILLPAIIIGLDNAGQIVKTLYEELREAATAAHVRTARAKGLSATRRTFRHLLPTAIPTALSLSGLVLAGLVGGTLTMEVLFGLPGLGSLMLNAIHGRDYPVIQAAMVVIALGVVVVNLCTDLLQKLIDPRLSR
jgi:peptide/nickel transport system permease protein